jgi:hypothetical protein
MVKWSFAWLDNGTEAMDLLYNVSKDEPTGVFPHNVKDLGDG